MFVTLKGNTVRFNEAAAEENFLLQNLDHLLLPQIPVDNNSS